MNELLFLIGIGGTGMRCVEAFAHLCAIGMMEGKEVHILTIDTDTNNGNKSQTEQTLELYCRIKGLESAIATHDTFFSAKLHLYKFAPQYSGAQTNFDLISGINAGSQEIQAENRALAELLFDPAVREFDLVHGYRAQTHLGSHLMYHTLLEATQRLNQNQGRKEDQELGVFLDALAQAGDNARVFIMGSLFGGTGASSIPILPQALNDSIKLRDNMAEITAKYGCTLLSNYFTFNPPSGAQVDVEKVIADSKRFALNSQAALKFYQTDPTVKRLYSRMYHIGWPQGAIDFDKERKGSPTITGGDQQKNQAHLVELVSAAAACDYFLQPSEELNRNQILYRSLEYNKGNFNFNFKDFFGDEQYKRFMGKLAAFYALTFLVHSEDGDIKVLAKKLDQYYNTHDFQNLTSEQAEEINRYIKQFGFDLDREEKKVIPGWFHQIQKSSENMAFLFIPQAFAPGYDDLVEFDYGQIFKDTSHNYTTGGGLFRKFRNTGYISSGKQYDAFLSQFREINVQEDQNVVRVPEQLLARIHNTFLTLYKISDQN